MEFIEATLKPNFLPKIFSKEVSVVSKNPRQKQLNSRKNAEPHVAGGRHSRAMTHARPCVAPATAARPCCLVHGRALLRLVSDTYSGLRSTSYLP